MSVGLSPRFPISLSELGDFANITEVKDLVKQNFKNLLLTVPGERIMIPDFGVGLQTYLFEFRNGPNGSITGIKNNIQSQVSKYLPYIEVISVQVTSPEQDDISVSLRIGYFIKPLSITDEIVVR